MHVHSEFILRFQNTFALRRSPMHVHSEFILRFQNTFTSHDASDAASIWAKFRDLVRGFSRVVFQAHIWIAFEESADTPHVSVADRNVQRSVPPEGATVHVTPELQQVAQQVFVAIGRRFV